MTKGTNLSDNSCQRRDPARCRVIHGESLFGRGRSPDVKEGNTEYSVAELGEGAAGNLYEEHVYALVGTSPCLAVRYLIHSGNMAMYDPGTVRAFDEPAVLRQFDKIRKSLVVGR